MNTRWTRRSMLVAWSGAVAALAAGCQTQAVPVAPAASPTGGSPAAPTTSVPASAPTQAPAAASVDAPLAQVARNQTLIMSVSDTFNQFQDASLANPFLRGTQRTGWHFMFEPLFFYNPYMTPAVTWPKGVPGRENEIPWLAESYAYNADNTDLTLKLRPGVTWSDGQPFGSHDVAFTLNMLKTNSPDLLFSFDMLTWVKDVQTPDPQTAVIALSNPNAQFMGLYFQWYLDLGFPIVPEHVFKGQEQKTFANLDPGKDWPVTTGPWKLVSSTADQKIYDRRDDWWGARTGFRQLPRMKRIVVLPRLDDSKKVQLLINNEVDTTHVLFESAVQPLLQRNQSVAFWTADNGPPYGLASGANIVMGFNCAKPPFDDADIRWAINYAIDRKQVNDTIYRGLGEVAALPFAALPTLKPYADASAGLLGTYPTTTPDSAKTAQILQSKGWQKDGEGFWAKDGQRFPLVIQLSPGFFQDIAPLFVAQLRKAGFDASFKSPTNFSTLVQQGDADAFMQFDTSVYSDPWVSLDQYHSRYFAPTGQTAPQPFRWRNPEFDTLVEKMGRKQRTDAAFMQLFQQAMDIWLKNLPTLPMLRWYLYIPFNTTYWKGWPNARAPYIGGGDWHRGAVSVLLHGVDPA